jgi:hypothetical protein
VNRSVAAVIAISFLTLACGKDKQPPVAAPVVRNSSDALSTKDPCVMMACRTPDLLSTATATDTSVATPSLPEHPPLPRPRPPEAPQAPKPPEPDTSLPPPPIVVKPAPPVAPPPTKPAPPPTKPVPPPAKPLPKPQPPPAPPPVTGNSDLQNNQRMAMNASLTCQNNDCDASVGLLTVVTSEEGKWSVGQCTASLVGSDTIVTNAHCVPQDISAAGSSCAGRLWLTFAADPAHPEYDRQIGCGSVISARKDRGLDGADYAFLKLDRASNRPALRLSHAGFEADRNFHVHKINPVRVANGMGGFLQKIDCRSMYDSDMFDAPLDSQSQTMLLVDCEIIPGNSGSPIFADDGSARGVIYAYVKKPDIHDLLDKNGSVLPDAGKIADLNTASNFACLRVPPDVAAGPMPEACASQADHLAQKKAAYFAARANVLRPAAQRLISANQAGRSDIAGFGWSLSLSKSDDAGLIGQGVPACVNRAAASPILNRDSLIRRPFFFVKARYDQYLRGTAFAPVWGGFAKNAEALRLDQMDQQFHFRISDRDSGEVQVNGSLGLCPSS